ncbi:MAG: hypothetical protein U9O55_01780 [Patescibacteria group bacterium]|nr:hypothetical protein [Patescibacteria group bacterium]
MLNKKDNLIIFVLCLIVVSLGVLVVVGKPFDIKVNKNINNNININKIVNQNTNQIVNNNNDKNQTPENFVKKFYDYYLDPHYSAGISGFDFVKNSNYLSDSFLKRIEGDKFRPYLSAI